MPGPLSVTVTVMAVVSRSGPSWISIRDPDFAVKAKRVLDLYARTWNGEPLGDDEYVISADEKTSIQARCRCHPTLPPGKARTMRVEHDYHRGGAITYLTAYDVHHAKVIGRCAATTGITRSWHWSPRSCRRSPTPRRNECSGS